MTAQRKEVVVAMLMNKTMYERIIDHLYNYATDATQPGGAWFTSEDKFEDWASDVFWDLLQEAFNEAGVKLYDDEM